MPERIRYTVIAVLLVVIWVAGSQALDNLHQIGG